MTITKFTYDNIAGSGFKWHPVTNEGDVLFYPCGTLKGVKAFRAYLELLKFIYPQTKGWLKINFIY